MSAARRNAAGPASAVPADADWDKELAPKVTRGQIIFAVALYVAWTVFLIVLAVMRWFGDLQ